MKKQNILTKSIRKYRNSRIININANIILAGIISALLGAYPVYWTKYITNNLIEIAIISFILDGIIDFGIFAILHVTINLNKSKKLIFKDLIKIQGQRIVFSIIYFIVAVGLHILLMYLGMNRTNAFIISYIIAIFFTRIAHTIYGIKTGLFKNL